MIIKPVATEKAIKLIEIENTILFEVDSRATKKQIKEEFEKLFKAKVEKINTQNKGSKKIAYIKLNNKTPAIDIATSVGII
jgi:large subunit ribosomal protein L23